MNRLSSSIGVTFCQGIAPLCVTYLPGSYPFAPYGLTAEPLTLPGLDTVSLALGESAFKLTGDALKQAIHSAVKTEIGDIPVPPKYTSADFYPHTWKLRGKLDAPKERWISYPSAERTADPTLVLAWAGWTHLQQAQAVAGHYERLKANGASDTQQGRLLASLAELLPWLIQWHNEVDPTFGECMSDYFVTFVEAESQRLQITPEPLKQLANER